MIFYFKKNQRTPFSVLKVDLSTYMRDAYLYWVTQKLPQICTATLRIRIGLRDLQYIFAVTSGFTQYNRKLEM